MSIGNREGQDCEPIPPRLGGIFPDYLVMLAGMRATDELSAGGMSRESPYLPQPTIGMTPLSQLTRRNFLIAAHDALALLTSFCLPFKGGDAFYARLPLLLRILPLLVVFSIVICYVFNLTSTKWRFIVRSWHLLGRSVRAC
ncbi:hypothetical protein CQ12_04845 [Bradyrhizobium jicamae]|uniref:Uncharacterized protein n=1 Tax=Bradyrhizobium jicamae TaxID=280332 RepID=A0A0R3KJ28_9BRAD|nr:hypothetical protein [Bradyrhizobium jicamae]KRQ94845.1 hypothetical protein CQ12_04845 [Bradyrhizobium jicamae]